MTDFCYERDDDPQAVSFPGRMLPSSSSAMNVEKARRNEERAKQLLESNKPSPYSNFLLSAVTSPGCHKRGPVSSPTMTSSAPYPYLVPGYRSPGYRDSKGQKHAAPHLHNHCSRGYDSPYREGESLAAITGDLNTSTPKSCFSFMPFTNMMNPSGAHRLHFPTT